MESEGIILVMGSTGAGKSYFLNRLKEQCAEEGHTLYSKTSKCLAVEIILDDDKNRRVTVVDTPGFNDTTRAPGEILAEITDFLTAQYQLGIPLKGVLYLHKIVETRMHEGLMSDLRILEDLVGDAAMPNLLLVTTMWNKIRDEDYGEKLELEQQLLDDFWLPMRKKGSYATQFDGTSDGAFAILWQLAGKEPVVLQIQKEIEESNPDVLHTTAGASLVKKLEMDRADYQKRLAKLEDDLAAEKRKGGNNRTQLQKLQTEKTQLKELMKKVDSSMIKMEAKPGSDIRERVKQAMTGKTASSASAVLAIVLDITLFVVKLVAF